MKKGTKNLQDIWEQVPPDYYQSGVKSNLLQWIWHTWKWKSMIDIFKDLEYRPLNILDVGCASGYLTAQIAIFFGGSGVFGVDSYKKAIEFGIKTYPRITFKIADIHKLPFKDQSFDLITCIETLEHVANPQGAIQEMRRCLKKGGYILIGQDTDNFLFKIIWIIWTKTRGKVWNDSHIHPYDPKKLKQLIKGYGFKIIKEKYSHIGLEVFFLAKKI